MNTAKRSRLSPLNSPFKQTEAGVIPEDWSVVTLNGITSEIGDGIHATPQYSASGDYFFVNGNNIQNGRIVITKETKSADASELTFRTNENWFWRIK